MGDPSPPGTPYSPIPAPPSADADALRFAGGVGVWVAEVSDSTPVADINAAFTRSTEIRAAMSTPTASLDYRVVVAQPGTYDLRGWVDPSAWASIISASGSGDPDVVLRSDSEDASAGTIDTNRGSLHLEGCRVVAAENLVDINSDGFSGEKYPIHFHGGQLHLAHCTLENLASLSNGTACLGMDNASGNQVQLYDVAFVNLMVGESYRWSMNAHCGSADPTPVQIKMKGCDVSHSGVFAWDNLGNEAREGVDMLWVNDTPGVTSGGADSLPIITDPITWATI